MFFLEVSFLVDERHKFRLTCSMCDGFIGRIFEIYGFSFYKLHNICVNLWSKTQNVFVKGLQVVLSSSGSGGVSFVNYWKALS